MDYVAARPFEGGPAEAGGPYGLKSVLLDCARTNGKFLLVGQQRCLHVSEFIRERR